MVITGPKQTIIISCRGTTEILGRKKEIDNLITLDWHMLTSHEPPMYAISIGKNRFSLNLLRNSGVFCVNFLDKAHKDLAINCGSTTGAHTDKFKEFEIEKDECKTIDCPKIKEALAHLECSIEKELETGDHIILSGKILDAEINSDGKRLINIGNTKGKYNFTGI